MDVKEDTRLGLKSTAILFGPRGKLAIGVCYALTVAAWSLGGWLSGMSPLYYVGMTAIAAHLAWRKLSLVVPTRAVRQSREATVLSCPFYGVTPSRPMVGGSGPLGGAALPTSGRGV